MIWKQGKLFLLFTLILFFGILIANTEKEKKKEPIKTSEASAKAGLIPLPDGDPNLNYEVPTIEVEYINGKPHGKVLERYKDGSKIDGEYNNGLKNGLWIHYDHNGRKFKQESYKNGKKEGKSISWDESGYVYETQYKDNLFHGKQSSWDKNGKLVYEHGYKDGKPHGRYLSWHANGKKSDDGYFVEGTGKLSTWYPSGKLSIERELKNGKPFGKEIWWYENGQKEREQTFNEEGKKIGKLTHWFEDGKIAFEIEFDQNGLQRCYKEYDKNGNLIIEDDR